ncbi:MAG: alpha/beta fold hydrolase [Cyanobacteriota bacterium]|nr:alpha/beta fold hydrolase [Cyanobacteriota bacterium]
MTLHNQPFLWKGSRDYEQAFLLLHGLGGGVYELQYLGEVIHHLGYTVQGINFPGHDTPTAKMPPSHWIEWYDAILRTYGQLRQDYRLISVVGFSTGCPLALRLALAESTHCLILLAPFLAIRHRWYYLWRPEQYLQTFGTLIGEVPRLTLPIRDPQMRLAAQKVAFFQTFNLGAVSSALQLIAEVKPKLADIDCPTLIVQSRQDSVVDPAGAEEIYRKIQSPVKKLVWLEKSDHIISLDWERELVFEEVRNFIQSSELSAS